MELGAESSVDTQSLQDPAEVTTAVEDIPVTDEQDAESLPKVQVDFDITLTPFGFDISKLPYAAEHLQVTVQVGEVEHFADWVSGETWTTSIELNQETEYEYTVMLADKFGQLVLASNTGTIWPQNSDTYAEEVSYVFIDYWDEDGDGAPNYTEIIEGTDPLVAEQFLLDISVQVPPFVSDTLGLVVQVVDGEQSAEAQWLTGEQWHTKMSLLKRGSVHLIITFYDHSGDVVLASVQTDFEEYGLSHELNITVSQPDIIRWDNDFDGISNLAEKRQGSFDPNPTIDSIPFALNREGLSNEEGLSHSLSLADWSRGYEEEITDARPYQFSIDEIEYHDHPEDFTSTKIAIDIDSNGTGSFFKELRHLKSVVRNSSDRSGNRIRSDNSVAWNGSYYRFNGEASVGWEADFEFQTTQFTNQLYSHAGSILRTPLSGWAHTEPFIDMTFDITGGEIDEEGYCRAAFGTMSFKQSYDSIQASLSNVQYQFEKQANDANWSVQVTYENGFVDNISVRNVDTRFYCAFPEFR